MPRKPVKKKRFSKNRVFKKKKCRLCGEKIIHVDFKDSERLSHYLSEKGKIVPRRISGACAKHQRVLSGAIKRSRIACLMPFRSE